ncbi:hypothetical protein H4582DRAFT_2056348 [Lactarius indigo]|nr:hypothetical protein H4582DRAFT_2056348 [Lactarius indigo]
MRLARFATYLHRTLRGSTIVILPLLNSLESLEVIDELWDSPNNDVAPSIRCAAAAVPAFMNTPSLPTNPDVFFIRDDNSGKEFLDMRLRTDADADGGVTPEHDSDSARLQNWWTSNSAKLIRREGRALFDALLTEVYCAGNGTFDQQRDRRSPAFVPGAQQDIIIRTLKILTRGPIANARQSIRHNVVLFVDSDEQSEKGSTLIRGVQDCILSDRRDKTNRSWYQSSPPPILITNEELAAHRLPAQKTLKPSQGKVVYATPTEVLASTLHTLHLYKFTFTAA